MIIHGDYIKLPLRIIFFSRRNLFIAIWLEYTIIRPERMSTTTNKKVQNEDIIAGLGLPL